MEYELKEVLLRIVNVGLSFGDKVILRDINAEIRNVVQPGKITGQVEAILGPSGVGKTQLFKIIAGLQRATTGQVLLNSTGIPVKRGEVGVVAQNYPLFMHRTALGNLVVAAKQAGYTAKNAEDKSKQLLANFGLSKHAGLYPAQLSGGQRQRVAICQQIICSRHFVLMDEPFSGLDPLAIQKVRELIADVANSDELNTIIVVTHDIRTAVASADNIWLLGRELDERGQIRPGATIVKKYDMMADGLTWHPEITKTPEFDAYYHMVREEFEYLEDPTKRPR